MKRLTVRVLLAVTITVLLYFIFKSITEPVIFKKEFEKRKSIVIKKLIDIRTAQIAYKNRHGKYSAEFNELFEFIRNEKIFVMKYIADTTDPLGIRTYTDTVRTVNITDSLFPGKKLTYIDSLRYIPFSEGVEFNMDAGEIEMGKVIVPVFEISVAYKDFLFDLNENLYDTDGGLKLGSMTEPVINGNWE